MTQIRGVFFLAILGTISSWANAASTQVFVVPLTGAIGPATADFAGRALARAEKEGAQLVVLRIDTPGGLDLSMRQIIKDILASPVPVAAFVAPSGARAASAGTYILYASHIAAMAEGTNLGAATPVNIAAPSPVTPTPTRKPDDARDNDKDGKHDKTASEGAGQDAMTKKQVSDAAAYIRAFAQMRGRNAEWAERAVRDGVSLSAEEALAQKVIDLTARDVPDLLSKLDGRKVTTAGGERTLATAGATLIISGGTYTNTGGTILNSASTLQIIGATINGGTVSQTGAGTMQLSGATVNAPVSQTGAGLIQLSGGGTIGGSPAITASATAQHATLLARGPIESSVVDSGVTPSRGMRYCVGLKPTMPQSAAGMRTEPPVSVPIATTAPPSLTDTAAPDEDPPGISRRS